MQPATRDVEANLVRVKADLARVSKAIRQSALAIEVI
jgi:hypothetical protein